MTHTHGTELGIEELESQHGAELPARDLMVGLSLLGLPLVSVDGIGLNIDTSGPGWLIGSVGGLG
jgi:hypothetical protein